MIINIASIMRTSIRQALTNYIANITKTKQSYKKSFGIWGNKKLDSLEYQNKLRSEWK